MTESRLFPAQSSDEDKLLCARIADAFEGAAGYDRRFVGFIDPHGRALAHSYIKRSNLDGCGYAFFGGYKDAERVILGVFPPYDEPTDEAFPVTAICLKWRFEKLNHRDFLGALLSLGIKREKIGDIVVCNDSGEGKCIVFAEKTVAAHIAASLEKVGRAGISCEITDGISVTREENFKDITDTIPSPRLDCVVGALTGLSRADSSALIRQGLVSLQFEQCCENSREVDEGATVSIRGHGRFVIDSIGPRTRKGRLSFSARKYL